MNAAPVDYLQQAARSWASWMFDISWQVALLVVALAAIGVLLRGSSARFRYVLWLLIVVRLLAPPGLAFPTGWGWWLRPWQVAASTDAPPGGALNRSSQEARAPEKPAAAVAASPAGPGAVSWSVVLMIGWLGIVTARCGMLLTAALEVRVWVSRARPIVDPAVLRLLADSCHRVGVRRSVGLRNSESCATPLVVGVWRPVLLLPSAVLERLDASELRAVLIHELYHVKRWDGAVNLLQGLLGAVYFFHPLVWWANRRIRQLREDACDERTVSALEGRRKPYGAAIFKVAEILGYAEPPLALGVLDSKSPLKKRLARILDPHLPVAGRLGWRSVAVVVAVGAVLIPAGPRPSSAGVARASARSEPRLEPIATSLAAQGPEPAIAEADRRGGGAGGQADPPAQRAAQVDALLADLVADDARRAAAVASLRGLGPAVEPAVLEVLAGADEPTRRAVYAVLEKVGTRASALVLHRALFERDENEQIAVRRALDAVYRRIEASPSESGSSVNSLRIVE